MGAKNTFTRRVGRRLEMPFASRFSRRAVARVYEFDGELQRAVVQSEAG
jgi:hypothetical protein